MEAQSLAMLGQVSEAAVQAPELDLVVQVFTL